MRYVWSMFTALVLSGALALPVAGQPIGEVTRLKGKADLWRPPAEEPLEVFRGMPVHKGDRIITQRRSRVRILLNDGSTLSLGAKAELTLDEFQFSPQQKTRRGLFNLTLGKLRVFASDLIGFKERELKVKTPTAIAGLRGTLFMVWVISKDLTRVVCLEKEIWVANIFKPAEYLILTRQLATDIMRLKPPTRPVKLSPEQLRKLQEGLGTAPSLKDITRKQQGVTTTTTTLTTTLPDLPGPPPQPY